MPARVRGKPARVPGLALAESVYDCSCGPGKFLSTLVSAVIGNTALERVLYATRSGRRSVGALELLRESGWGNLKRIGLGTNL